LCYTACKVFSDGKKKIKHDVITHFVQKYTNTNTKIEPWSLEYISCELEISCLPEQQALNSFRRGDFKK
jgi:hypothetical protein